MREHIRTYAAFFIVLAMISFLSYDVKAEARIFTIDGYVFGPCGIGSSLNITIYAQGQVLNPAFEINSQVLVANGVGLYGGALNWDTTDYGTGDTVDVFFNITNPGCSATAQTTLSRSFTTGAIPGDERGINHTMFILFTLHEPGDGSVTSDNTTFFNWSYDLPTASYDFVLDDNADLSSPLINDTISDTNYTVGTELVDDTYYWKVFVEQANYVDNSTTYSVIVSASGPVILSMEPDNETWHGPGSYTINITTNINSECRYSTTPGQPFGSKTVMDTTGMSVHGLDATITTDGDHFYYFECNSTGGILMFSEAIYNLTIDSRVPDRSGASTLIDNGAAYSGTGVLNVSWSGFTDPTPGSGIAGYYHNSSNEAGTTAGIYTAATNGTFTVTTQGSVTIYVWAEDNVGNIGLQVFDSIIVDLLPPQISLQSTNPSTLSIGHTGNFLVYVTVSDQSPIGTPVIRSRIGSDAWSSWLNMSLYLGSVYQYLIPEQSAPDTWYDRGGEYLYFEVNASDLFNRTNQVQFSEFIQNSTTPPVLNPISDQNVNQDQLLDFLITASDTIGDTLTYSCNDSVITITKIDENTANVTWTPDMDDVGLRRVIFTVSDGTYNDSQLVLITVNNVNDDPVLQPIGDLVAYEYIKFNHTCNASDVDGDSLTYSDNASLFNIAPLTGKIEFTPTYANRGSYSINITVLDGNGGRDYEEIEFTVAYCGDDVCDSEENCSTCPEDCNTCEEETSAAILIDPRNCLNETMTIRAVPLVKRTECETMGLIINGKEVCGNLSDMDINIYRYQFGDYQLLDTLTTDKDGYIHYLPEYQGDYRLELSTSQYGDVEVVMTVKECLEEEKKESSVDDKTDDSTYDYGDHESQLEIPGIIEESQLENMISAVLFYFIIPMLILVLMFVVMAYIYKLEKKKSGSKYVNSIDMLIGKCTETLDALTRMLKENRITNKLTASTRWVFGHLKELRSNLMHTQFMVAVSEKTGLMIDSIQNVLVKRMVAVPFIALGDEYNIDPCSLILISSVKYHHSNMQAVQIMKNISGYKKISNLAGLAHVSSDLNLNVVYYNSQKPSAQIDEIVAKGAKYVKKTPNLNDIEFSINKKRIPVVIVDFGKVNNLKIKAPVFTIVTGFDNKYLYVHDYVSKKQKSHRRISKKLFWDAWSIPGANKEMVILGKKIAKKEPKIREPKTSKVPKQKDSLKEYKNILKEQTSADKNPKNK